MLKPLWLHLDTIAGRLRSTRNLYVGCDFDGTLTDIVPHPDLAVLTERTRAALEAVAALPGAELAVFSGRPLDDLKGRLPDTRSFLSGIAGLETIDNQGTRRAHVSPSDSIANDVREVMQQWCARFEGAWFEDKGPAFAVHYRAVPERFQPAFCSGVRRRFAGDPPRARLLHGKKVFDVLPMVDRDKAGALADWYDRPDALLFYFGDDANDEPVYPKVRERGGISVAIGRWASHAEYGLTAPEHVTWFLEWLTREWTEARSQDGKPQPGPSHHHDRMTGQPAARRSGPDRATESHAGGSTMSHGGADAPGGTSWTPGDSGGSPAGTPYRSSTEREFENGEEPEPATPSSARGGAH